MSLKATRKNKMPPRCVQFFDEHGRPSCGVAADVDPKAARSLVSSVIQGTTTRVWETAVLWMGKHYALVWFSSGSYSDNGGSHYFPASVYLPLLKGADSWNKRGREVHDSSTGQEAVEKVTKGSHWSSGRLTENTIDKLIARAEIEDASFLEKEALKNAAREAKERAEEDGRRRGENERLEIERKKVYALTLAKRIDKGDYPTVDDQCLDGGRLARLVLELGL